MDREFWSKSREWPRDQQGFVFLGRAVEEVGCKLFGEQTWAAELSAFDAVLACPTPAPDLNDATEFYAKLPEETRHRLSSEQVGMILARQRVQGSREAAARIGAARERLERILDPVQEMIAARAADGALCTASRPLEGGELSALKPSHWFTDRQRIAARFVRCRVSQTNPFDNSPDGSGYIFVERDGLQRVLNQMSPIDLSPYEVSSRAEAAIRAAMLADQNASLASKMVSRSTTKVITAKPVTQVRGGRPTSILRRPSEISAAASIANLAPVPSPLVQAPPKQQSILPPGPTAPVDPAIALAREAVKGPAVLPRRSKAESDAALESAYLDLMERKPKPPRDEVERCLRERFPDLPEFRSRFRTLRLKHASDRGRPKKEKPGNGNLARK